MIQELYSSTYFWIAWQLGGRSKIVDPMDKKEIIFGTARYYLWNKKVFYAQVFYIHLFGDDVIFLRPR